MLLGQSALGRGLNASSQSSRQLRHQAESENSEIKPTLAQIWNIPEYSRAAGLQSEDGALSWPTCSSTSATWSLRIEPVRRTSHMLLL